MAPTRRPARTPQNRQRLCAILVEPDPDYATVVQSVVEHAGLDWRHAEEVGAALHLLTDRHVELVVFGADPGGAAAGAQRIHDATAAALIVLAADLDEAREAFDAGADHVLPRPFAPGHLAGAIGAVLRSREQRSAMRNATGVRVADVVFDAERRELRTDDGFRIRFSAREWELLAVLLTQAGRFVTADDLRREAWGDDRLGRDQVRGYVYRLRRKLEERPLPCRLLTTRGSGYCLRLETAPRPVTRS